MDQREMKERLRAAWREVDGDQHLAEIADDVMYELDHPDGIIPAEATHLIQKRAAVDYLVALTAFCDASNRLRTLRDFSQVRAPIH